MNRSDPLYSKPEPTCPQCGSPEPDLYKSSEDVEEFRCDECGYMWAEPTIIARWKEDNAL